MTEKRPTLRDLIRAFRGARHPVKGRHDQALTVFNRGIELNPEHAAAFVGRGETYRKMGRYDDALADFSRAIELDPQHASALGWRGRTYWAMQRADEALADLNRAIELNPDEDDYLLKRAEIQRHIGPAQPTALQDYPPVQGLCR
jgi:tetratricopeptide (TPR) repeat protein